MQNIILIAAYAKNRVIGNEGKLPWHISADLKRFKLLTLNNAVIMGKNTYESILSSLGKPLPKRKNIVLTSNQSYPVPEGVDIATDIKDALKKAESYENVYIIGGSRVFSDFINSGILTGFELTIIDSEYEGDSYIPQIDLSKYKLIKKEDMDENGINFSFVTYVKK